MELIRHPIRYYEKSMDNTFVQEESAELIVPDLYPDILRVVEAFGLVCVKEKSVHDGRAEISGAVRVSVLYQPEDEVALKHVDATLPFSHQFSAATENSGANPSESMALLADAVLLGVSAHTLNPRKLSVTFSVGLSAKGYTPTELPLCSDVENADELNIELLRETHMAYVLVAVKDKTFTIVDELETSGSPIADILHADARLNVLEVKSIGNKAVFKGLCLLKILHRGAHGLETAALEVPFSQILEVENMEEGMDCRIGLVLCGLELEPRGDSRMLGLTLQLLAQVDVWAKQPLETVADLYSTTYDLQPTLTRHTLSGLADRASRRQTARGILEISEPARSVLDAQVGLTPVTLRQEEGAWQLYTEASVKVVYLTEEEAFAAAQTRIPVVLPLELPDDASCDAKAVLSGDVSALVAAEGIEIRFAVDFETVITHELSVSAVDGLTGDAETPRDLSGSPSVILRRVMENEPLWEIAKRYHTTCHHIIGANGLCEEESLAAGQLLLIPRKK